MSYTVDVLAVQIPSSYREALAVRDALTDVRDARLGTGTDSEFEEPSADMEELHRRLTARYPCITDDPDGPWSDGPLINNFGQHAATLGISFSRVGEVLLFLIETATGMGFWVVDAQDETVHLPGGTIIRPVDSQSGRAWWKSWK